MKRSVISIGILLLLLPSLAAQQYYSVRKQTRISTGGLDEAAAVRYLDDEVVYITESTSVGASSPTDDQGRRLFTMFLYKESTGQKRPFIDALVTQRHEGPASFTSDFKTMVFSQQRPSAVNRDYDPLKLFFAENVDGQWTNIREFEHNDDYAWLFSPALSPDGTLLFFAANFKGGYGGYDLYWCRRNGEGWTDPENLGPGVNSEGNELYPFYHSSGRLCFSSDGHDGGLSGYDLFETSLVDGKWANAIKLMPPFNSLSDDYHAWFSEDLKSGFLTSNRGSSTKEIFEFYTDIPVMDQAAPIKKTYYTYKIYDRNLDTVDNTLFRYSWVINDTLEIPGHEIIYHFPGPGTYVCKLKVFDIQLDTLVEGTTVKTLNIRLNEQAVINCPDTLRVNAPAQFDGSASYLPGFDIGRYVWDFGDGKFGEGIEVEHAYYYPGRYRVILGVVERKRNRRHQPEVKANFRDIVVLPE
jgi:hypothetical protein